MVAKVVIEPYSRILVDKWYEADVGHPEIANLTPVDGLMSEKFDMNSFRCGAGVDGICLRLSRVNHACRPNASHHSDDITGVKILYSTSEILPGEEICISYTGCFDFAQQLPPNDLSKWGFGHDADCAWLNSPSLIKRGHELDEMIKRDSLCKDGRAFLYVAELLSIHDSLGSFMGLLRSRTLFDGFQIGMMRKKTVEKALEYMKESVRMDKMVANPNDPQFIAAQGVLQNPERFPYYRKLDF
jgi:hypothetical protein